MHFAFKIAVLTMVTTLPAGILQAQETVTLDTLPILGSRVSAELPLRTRTVQIWTRQDLERSPARTVADVLGWSTGVELSARSPAQADLSIRGAGFEQVLVLVDGVRVSDPQTGHFDLDLALPLEGVERIEILRGPASAAYGSDAVGGVVNVITRSDRRWSGRMEGGSFGSVAASLHGGIGLPRQSELDIAAEQARSDGHREGTDWDHRLVNLTLRTPVGGGRLTARAGNARRAFGADGFYGDFPSFETTRVRTAHVGWSSSPVRRLQVQPRVAWRSHGDDFILFREDPAFYRNRHTSTQLVGEVTARAAVSARLQASAGIEAGLDELESNALGTRSENRAAVFGEAALRLPEGIDVSMGLRHDGHDEWEGFTSPSLGVAFQPAERLRLRGAAGRSFRGPTWTERHYEDPAHVARADLRPERSTSFEAGLDLEPGSGIRIALTGFRRTSRDLIDWARAVGDVEAVWETTNVNEAVFQGFEMEGAWTIDPRTAFTMGTSHLSLDADVAPGLESKYALRPLTDQIHLGVSREFAADTRTTVRVTRARRSGEASYHTVDLRLAAPVLGGILFLDATNLTGSEHLDVTGHAVAGRAVHFGIRVGG